MSAVSVEGQCCLWFVFLLWRLCSRFFFVLDALLDAGGDG